MTNPIGPIPQDKIGEVHPWRDFLQRVSVVLRPGVSGTFKSADATPKTITVVNGIITSIV